MLIYKALAVVQLASLLKPYSVMKAKQLQLSYASNVGKADGKQWAAT